MTAARGAPAGTAPAGAERGAMPLVWVNGRPVDPGAPQLSALDRGFMLADGLFETMRAYRGAIFRLERHLARLADGARALEIALPPWLGEHVASAMGTAAGAGLREAAVRLTVSRGAGPAGLAAPPGLSPTVVLVMLPPPAFPRAVHAEGLSAVVARGRRDEHAITSGLKTLAYAESIAALAEARRQGADEAIFLDTAGHVSEATASNVFAGVAGALVTPPVTCGVLPGITRAAVCELAPRLGLRVEERPLGLRELAEADEAFLTSSLREVAPLVRVNGRGIGGGAVGRLTRRVMDAYGELVRRECAPPEGAP